MQMINCVCHREYGPCWDQVPNSGPGYLNLRIETTAFQEFFFLQIVKSLIEITQNMVLQILWIRMQQGEVSIVKGKPTFISPASHLNIFQLL